jgi:hypothetical protein
MTKVLRQYFLEEEEMNNYQPENERKKKKIASQERILYKLQSITDNNIIIFYKFEASNTNKQ